MSRGRKMAGETKKSEKKRQIYKVVEILVKKYPKIFNKKEPKPLKIGILEDIAEDLGEELSKTEIKKGLKYYTSAIQYHQAIMAERYRVNLNGNRVSLISEEHKEFAQKQLGKLLLRKQALEKGKENRKIRENGKNMKEV